jgi:hypothetical protein
VITYGSEWCPFIRKGGNIPQKFEIKIIRKISGPPLKESGIWRLWLHELYNEQEIVNVFKA